MATKEAQARWRERCRQGQIANCHCCGKRLRSESKQICQDCWLKTIEGRAYNQDKVRRSKGSFDQVAEAKRIAEQWGKELGFVARASSELEVINGIGFIHYQHRGDRQCTIYSVAVDKMHLKQGWGRLLFYRALCSCVEKGSDILLAKCPVDLPSNGFYERLGFQLVNKESGKQRPLNIWEYNIQQREFSPRRWRHLHGILSGKWVR